MNNLTTVCAIGALSSAILLYYGIRALTQTLAAGEVAVLPVTAEQPITLPAPGEIVLALRGKLFSSAFRGVSFRLHDARTGTEIPGSAILSRSSQTSLAGITTLSVRRFAVPAAGAYTLTASGLKADAEYKEARLVLQRAHGAAVLFRILWVVGASVLLITAVVFGLLAATGVINVS